MRERYCKLFTMSCKHKHTDLLLSQKLEIIQLAPEKVSQTEISQQLGCSQSTVSKIVSQKRRLSMMWPTWSVMAFILWYARILTPSQRDEISEDSLPAPKGKRCDHGIKGLYGATYSRL